MKFPDSFMELNLSAPVLKAISELGFEKPSPIQAQALPILLSGPTDFLGLAATGTGKTAAFALPLLERIDSCARGVQAIILCPTRELAVQVAGQIDLFGKYKGVRALPIYGGAGYEEQIRGLRRGVSVVVGTPGRLVDHITRGTLTLDAIETVVLDEADEMISMGFKEDLQTILGSVPEGAANTWLFSATMSDDVREVADEYLREPAQVEINRTEILPESIEQLYYITSESNKPEVLCKLIDAAEDFYGLVFCQTKSLVVDLNQYLLGRGYKADCLHGDMDQSSRERTMKAFRDRKVTLLVCTDVASRGLDVKDITHVINYSIPRELDSYVHRIGRTARSGKSGYAMSLVTGSHRGLIPRIERMTRSKMKEGRIPTRKEVGAKKVAQTLKRFQEQNSFALAIDLLGGEWKQTLASMSPEEIAGRFLALLHPEVFARAEPEVVERRIEPGKVVPRPGHGPGADRGPRPGHGPGADRGPRPGHGSRKERGPRPERGSWSAKPKAWRNEPQGFVKKGGWKGQEKPWVREAKKDSGPVSDTGPKSNRQKKAERYGDPLEFGPKKSRKPGKSWDRPLSRKR